MLRLRHVTKTLAILLCLVLLTKVLVFHGYIPLRTPRTRAITSPPPTPPSRGKVHVLLVSSWRSGSSFMGQVFNQNPSVFYLMEPAWHVWATLHMSGARELRMAVRDILRQVLKCDMSVMESYLPRWSKTSKLFVFSHSRALCSPPVCSLTPPGGFSNQKQCEKRCVNGTLDLAAEACRNHSHVVLKTVRIFELESLNSLLRDPTLDLRIVHLVRDPRAVFRSRRRLGADLIRDNGILLQQRKLKGIEADYHVMEQVCQSQVRIHRTATVNPPDFLRGRYMMLRYEDVVVDPLRHANAIYNFSSLHMSPRLQQWIYNATHGSGPVKDPFETSSRDAKDVSRAWRTTLPHQEVRHLQQICQDAMSLFGYRPVGSEKEQRELLQDVVLVPAEDRKFSWMPAAKVAKGSPSGG